MTRAEVGRENSAAAEPDAGDWTRQMDSVRRALAAVRESSQQLRAELASVRESSRRSRDNAQLAHSSSDALAAAIGAAGLDAGQATVQAMRERVGRLEHELEGLQRAMQTRGVIEQAKGMIMLRDRCDADTAFQTLVHVSQQTHRKLYDVAGLVVESARSDATDRTPRR